MNADEGGPVHCTDAESIEMQGKLAKRRPQVSEAQRRAELKYSAKKRRDNDPPLPAAAERPSSHDILVTDEVLDGMLLHSFMTCRSVLDQLLIQIALSLAPEEESDPGDDHQRADEGRQAEAEARATPSFSGWRAEVQAALQEELGTEHQTNLPSAMSFEKDLEQAEENFALESRNASVNYPSTLGSTAPVPLCGSDGLFFFFGFLQSAYPATEKTQRCLLWIRR